MWSERPDMTWDLFNTYTTTKVDYGDEMFHHHMSLFRHQRHMVTKPHSLAKPHHRMSRWQKIFVIDKNMIGDEIFSSPIRIIGDKTFSSPNILRHQTNDFSFVIFLFDHIRWRNISSPIVTCHYINLFISNHFHK